MEAGASGLPVVAADAGGTGELVGEPGGGLLVAPGDPVAFAGALDLLARTPSLRAGLGRKGRAAARARTWERSFAELREVHARAIEAARPDAAPQGRTSSVRSSWLSSGSRAS